MNVCAKFLLSPLTKYAWLTMIIEAYVRFFLSQLPYEIIIEYDRVEWLTTEIIN